MIEDYTIEQFKADFDDIESIEGKQEILNKLLDSDIDFSDSDIKESLIEYKEKISDLKVIREVEEDFSINSKIESGDFELYTCIKSVVVNFCNYSEGSNYYVSIDDVKSKLVAIEGVEIPDAIKDYVKNIKPLIWIVNDNGIGTLKRKNIFLKDFDFSEYFTKFVS